MRWENSLPDQVLGLWVVAVVGASPNMGAPWAQEGKYPSWGPGDRSYTGGFRSEIPWCDPDAVPDHLEWRPGHLLSLVATPPLPPVCATAASLAPGPTWLRSVSDTSVLSADRQGCALVCLALQSQPWPCSVALCHLLSTDVVTCWTRSSTRAPGILALECVHLSGSPRLAAVPLPPAPLGISPRKPAA